MRRLEWQADAGSSDAEDAIFGKAQRKNRGSKPTTADGNHGGTELLPCGRAITQPVPRVPPAVFLNDGERKLIAGSPLVMRNRVPRDTLLERRVHHIIGPPAQSQIGHSTWPSRLGAETEHQNRHQNEPRTRHQRLSLRCFLLSCQPLAQASGNALTSVIAAAGVPGSLRYSFVVPVAVSDTRIT